MIALFISLILLLFPYPVQAKFDPFVTANNKFGIHILDINDLADAAALVNSNGGQWGYVTIVIQEDDRNFDKWQVIFDQMRRYHLIPLVRLATKTQGDSWAKPTTDSIDDWVRFLNSLNWPIENRYVILFNEPNHANEWGKSINPEEYVTLAVEFSRKLHDVSEDFFVLPAALDVSASSNGASLDADTFLTRMVKHDAQILNVIDGWNSHSYPNPAFSGSAYATGRGTLQSYKWELDRLTALGLTKTLPIFITETGWVHREGMAHYTGMLSADAVAANMLIAANFVWSDKRIAAVTPFVLSYQGAPFDHFSWKKFSQSSFYPQYSEYQSLSKIQGEPWQREEYTFNHPLIPESLVAGSSYSLQSELTNKGQGILSQDTGYRLKFTSPGKFSVVSDPVPDVEPGQMGNISVHIETPSAPGTHPFTLSLMHGGREARVQSGTIKLVPPPAADIHMQLGWRAQNTTPEVTVLVYDHDTLLHKMPGLSAKGGVVHVQGLRNIVPNNIYRVVVLVPYYLPRQVLTKLGKNTTSIRSPRLYPLDFNRDGAWSWRDVIAMFRMKPNQIRALFIGL